MSFIELFLLAVSLSMDAFAAAICAGTSTRGGLYKKALIMGLYFGVFQAGMPIIGYYASSLFAETIIAFDHWVVFILLSLIGGKMIIGSVKEIGKSGVPARRPSIFHKLFARIRRMILNVKNAVNPNDTRRAEPGALGGQPPAQSGYSLKPSKMLPLAFATSVDAMAAGISFSFLRVEIIPSSSLIGVVTLIISAAGVKIGAAFGDRYKSKAELTGGIALVLIGIKILIEHTEVLKYFLR